MSLQTGTRLGPYEIVDAVASGGMGEVYRARDTRLGRAVAVKVLPTEFASDPERLRRFEQESRAAAALSHPNVLVVYDVGNHDGLSYVVTELLDGETLRARLLRGAFPARKAIEISVQIASGLAAAHAGRIVHRDLKPDNIFLTRDGQSKILDFGLAKIIGSLNSGAGGDDQTLRTEPGIVLGTAGYMSPEQVRGAESDHRSDIFSFGAVLYEMLSGEKAFRGNSSAETMSAILKENPLPLMERTVTAPPALCRIVERCLEKDPADRFQTVRDLKFALESISGIDAPVVAKKSERSIAVLPFTNMGAEPQQEFFSDGLADELINALARLPGLHVVSRTSAFRFRGREFDIRDIGRQLNVDTVLEGSIRRAGNRLRITVQLVNVSDGYHLWSERYDREMADVFEIQDEITNSIVKMLEPTLLGQQPSTARRHTSNVQAFELYLKGRHAWYQRTKTSLRTGIGYFQEAIRLDDGYALAHAGLADSFSILRVYGLVSAAEGRAPAQAAVKRAMDLDPTLAECHLAAALFTIYFTADWPAAEPHFQKAIELQPRSSMIQAYYGFFLAIRHRFEEAAMWASQATQSDPLSPFAHGLGGLTLYVARRYEDAIRFGERALELQPDFALGVWPLIFGSCQLKKSGKAIDLSERLVAITNRSPMYLGMLGMGYGLTGRVAEARTILEELHERSTHEYVFPLAALMIHVGLGDAQEIHKQLLACVNDDFPGAVVEGVVGPFLDEFASVPGVTEALRQLGMVSRAAGLRALDA